jgi:hypothetical protein
MKEKVELGSGQCNSCEAFDKNLIFVKSEEFDGIDFEICHDCARDLIKKLNSAVKK